ncbi:MAG: dihydropteroate synthase, partial [Spirochaetia bacterium]|nr:dihydropteroate synthase [Spirochaetia bacterium]
MGGCCGTSPDHIKELAYNMAPCSPRPADKADYAALSSAREAVITLAGSPVRIIGERINPTGKKKLQAELKEGVFTTVQTFAREQKSTGAAILDVNAGMPGINEEETLLKIISLLTPQTSLPLSIDTTNPEAAEKAMRFYPGRPLLNSISGESPRLEKLLPAAAKYGAMFILLPILGNQIPATAEERIEVIRNIYAKAEKYGFKKCDILIDGLAMTVSANQKAPAETLKTIKWAAQEGFGSVIGLSNISFGLPERKWANAAFLAMATQAGLTHVIANPMEEVLTNIKLASDLLSGTDPDGTNYITSFANKTSTPASPAKAAESPDQAVRNGIVNGIREDIKLAVKAALNSGFKPADILENMMIPAIVHVGDLYEKKEYFLPQLIASAETMKMGFTVLEPLLNSANREKKGKILFATVEGDIHDIGKNIVILMLRNYGFEVIDLGKDVKASKIIEVAEKEKPDIIALSALMTTTMIRMPEVIEQAKLSAIKAAFMVGGAVVTEDWAQSIGAHYSANGVEAVKKAQELIDRR